MTNSYLELKRKHEAEFNQFPMGFAFGNKQFNEAMEKLGFTEKDTDKVCSIGNGGFIRKTDSKAFGEMVDRLKIEKKEAIDNDPTGDGYIYDMFMYELQNHEYSYTYELEPTLDALGLTAEEVNANPKLVHGLGKAKKKIMAEN